MGFSNIFSIGWVLNLLGTFLIIAVWTNNHSIIKNQIIPSAILVDLMQSSRFPILTVTLLGIWLVVSIVENQWFTNHSGASLFGLALIGEAVRIFFTWSLIGLAYLLNFSNTRPNSTWFTKQIITIALIEIILVFFGGIFARWFSKKVIQKFSYGSAQSI
jgi:hypothetical protein